MDNKLKEELVRWLEYLYQVSNMNKATDKRLLKFIEYIKQLPDNKYEAKWEIVLMKLIGKFNETQDTIYLDVVQMMEQIGKEVK